MIVASLLYTDRTGLFYFEIITVLLANYYSKKLYLLDF